MIERQFLFLFSTDPSGAVLPASCGIREHSKYEIVLIFSKLDFQPARFRPCLCNLQKQLLLIQKT